MVMVMVPYLATKLWLWLYPRPLSTKGTSRIDPGFLLPCGGCPGVPVAGQATGTGQTIRSWSTNSEHIDAMVVIVDDQELLTAARAAAGGDAGAVGRLGDVDRVNDLESFGRQHEHAR